MLAILKSRIFFLVLFVLVGPLTYAGTIHGSVFNGRGALEGVVMIAESDKGVVYQCKTDRNGKVALEVPEGYYTVTLDGAEGLEIFAPDCGFYYEYIDGEVVMPFQTRSKGVVVDFGDPVGSGGGFTATLTASTFDFSVFINGLGDYLPDTVEISGYWYLPGVGPLDANAIGGWAAGAYVGSSLAVNYTNLGSGGMTLTLQQEPALSIDGEIATYRLYLSPLALMRLEHANGRLAFCGEYVRFYRNGQLIYDSGLQWNGNQSDLGAMASSSIK